MAFSWYPYKFFPLLASSFFFSSRSVNDKAAGGFGGKYAGGTIAKGQKYRVDSLPKRILDNRFSTKAAHGLENPFSPAIFVHVV